MHSHIQVLKGNIRVFCRVKPILQQRISEIFDDKVKNCIQFPCISSNELPTQLKVVNPANNESKLFHFDSIFPPESLQEDVFNEVKSFIQSAIDGENVCIFAYGQTGSGKTFTMEGPDASLLFDDDFKINELSGILPRSAEFIFKEIERIKKQFMREYKIEISSLEIYNEQVRDLYSTESTGANF